MSKNSTAVNFKGKHFFVGFDVHRKNWKVTIRFEGIELKTWSMDPSPRQLVRYLETHYPNGRYHAVHEAGYSGFWIHRALTDLGVDSLVVNPSDVPTTHKDKDRKSDQIDSRKLARELEKENLNGIYIPKESEQNLRLLARHLRRSVQSATRVKNRIKSFLSFMGIEYPDNSSASKAYIRWLESMPLDSGPAKRTLQFHVDELLQHEARTKTIEKEIKIFCKNTGDDKILKLLCTVPGIGIRTSIVLYTEIMDVHRFRKFDHLKAYAGLIPSTSSSGDRERTRGMSKRRNAFLRHVLIEASWVAIRKDPILLRYYSKACHKMKCQEAIVRIAKKLLSRIRHVWMTGDSYICSYN